MIRTTRSTRDLAVNVGRVTLYLLDADIEGNPEWTAHGLLRLYGGDRNTGSDRN